VICNITRVITDGKLLDLWQSDQDAVSGERIGRGSEHASVGMLGVNKPGVGTALDCGWYSCFLEKVSRIEITGDL
jgi:hypothetical protein